LVKKINSRILKDGGPNWSNILKRN